MPLSENSMPPSSASTLRPSSTVSVDDLGTSVIVCVVACFACQDRAFVVLTFNVCSTHLGSVRAFLLFDCLRSFLTTWSRSTRLDTRKEESSMCASLSVKLAIAMPVISRVVLSTNMRVRTRKI